MRRLAPFLLAIGLAGCAQPGGAGLPPRTATMTIALDVTGPAGRRVLADVVNDVTAAHVRRVEVTLTDTAPDAGAPLVAAIAPFDESGSTLTIANLALGHVYKVTSRAWGLDPNAADPADPTAELTDPDAALSTAYIEVPGLVDQAANQNVTGTLTDAAHQPLSPQKLPIRLYTPAFSGHAASAIQVTAGDVRPTDADVTAQ